MKVGEKLALGFFVVVLCIWGTVFIARNTCIKMYKEFELLKEDIIPGTIAMADIDRAATEIAHGVMDYMHHGRQEYRDKIEPTMENLQKLGLTHLEHKTQKGLEEQKKAKKLMAELQKFNAAVAQIIDLKGQGTSLHELTRIEREMVDPAMATLSQDLKEHKAVRMKKLTEAEESVRQARTSGMRNLLVSAVIITLMAVFFTIFITGSIVKPIYALHKGTEVIGRGNLGYRVGTGAKDEIGQLSRAFDQMTADLRETTVSKQYVENIIRGMSDSLVVVTVEGSIQTVNHATCKLLGYQPEELIGQNLGKVFSEEEQGLYQRTKFQELIKMGFIKGVERTFLTKDRVKIPMLFSGSVMHDTNGAIQGIICVASDISDLKRAEEALRESEERYRTILESIEEGYYEVDIAGNFTFFNDSLCKIFGYPRNALTGTNIRKLTYQDTARRGYQAFNRVYTTGKPIKGFEWEVIKKDQSIGDAEASVTLIKDAEGRPTGFRGIIRDVTERKLLEAQLRESQKMEVISTLAEGVAHQFNNALAAVTGNIELLEISLAGGKNIGEYIEPIKSSAHRMAHLTRQLLAYATGGRHDPQPMSLSDFVKNALPMIQSTVKPGICIETDLPSDVFGVEADHTQMEMVLSAVVANADEATEDRGRIRITTRNVEIANAPVKDHPWLKPGRYVSLSLEDDGKGMDKETRGRIFDPFFTTHVRGRGLGMATVYAIVRDHEGWISVDSEPGKGTAVRIYLPALEAEKAVKERVLKEREIEPARGEGTILVIEDEEEVMRIARQALQMLGYDVIEAKTGKEAIDTVRTYEGQIDLALLDIKLPDINGDKIYPLIMEARPNLKVIVFTGYTLDGPPREILGAGAEGFIQKPFSISTLADKLKEVLEGKQGDMEAGDREGRQTQKISDPKCET